MNNESTEYLNKSAAVTPLTVIVGILIGGLAGAVTMLMLAPQSGKDTRKKIQNKFTLLGDRITEFVDDSITQLRQLSNNVVNDGNKKILEIKQHGQDLAGEQLDHLSKAVKATKKSIKSA